MKTGTLEIIRDYIDLLENQLGLDIVIYDECRLLSKTTLSSLRQTGKWHTNPYCLKIKENKKLHKRCVNLKEDFVNKVLSGEGVVKSTCFCGVSEYVMPIKCGDRLVCMVSAVGFLGNLHECTYMALSRRIGLSYKRFMALRDSALLKADNEETVMTAIKILGNMLERYVTLESEIPDLLDTVRREANDYVLKACDYIAKSFESPITARDVAKHCHISESYLKHLFSVVTGHGVAEEIRICRLNYSKELLCTTEYSVRYISFASGFSSADYFSTVFKKQFEMSPLQYRKHKRV
ncbi:MAG: helix-turn-helix transcriptional regulator [Clostridia bacterium]|nr:helix-turn-helix transcriptional regulator [Clostridia bacterium]